MYNSFKPGQVWLDTDGQAIQAHGGGILAHDGVYYWYGENKAAPNVRKDGGGTLARVDVIGISCYSSTDLYNWKNEGVVLGAVNEPGHDLHPSGVLERPKVLYNHSTGQFVLWAHIDTADYKYARAGVAVSESPIGPFRYIQSFNPNNNDSRDMTVFWDDDGSAYLFHSSEWNATLYCSCLTTDYRVPDGTYTRNFVQQSREAPAVIKHGGLYYMVSSFCTGWQPNEAMVAVAEHPMGPWQAKGNPCVGPQSELTFGAQSTHFFTSPNGTVIFMADRWNPDNLQDSRYVWLPVKFKDEEMVIEWQDEWRL
jgi:hypothetical protein